MNEIVPRLSKKYFILQLLFALLYVLFVCFEENFENHNQLIIIHCFYLIQLLIYACYKNKSKSKFKIVIVLGIAIALFPIINIYTTNIKINSIMRILDYSGILYLYTYNMNMKN